MESAAALQTIPPPAVVVTVERQLQTATWHKSPTILEEAKLNKGLGVISGSGYNQITKTKFPAFSFTFPSAILNPSSSLTHFPPENENQMMKKATKRRGRPSSPPRATTTPVEFPSYAGTPTRRQPPAASNSDTLGLFQDLEISEYYVSPEPRSFPNSVKQQCWEKADKVKGRDPARWRRDSLGNIVFRKLVGCPGCLCHDYDHIVPYSKGGKSTLDNCQVLQVTANRSKGNRTELSKAELISRSNYCRVSGRDMDVVELLSYGNVQHVQDTGGCRIQ